MVAIAVGSLLMTGAVRAEGLNPPSGKYGNVSTAAVVLYDETTNLVAPSTETVAPYACTQWYEEAGAQCGNCEYVPDAPGSWQQDVTQYTYGRCISIDALTPLAGHGKFLLRIDVRTVGAENWAYRIFVKWTGTPVWTPTDVKRHCDIHAPANAPDVSLCAVGPDVYTVNDHVPGLCSPTIPCNFQARIELYKTLDGVETIDSTVQDFCSWERLGC